ncbi:MAG: twin-arginine translocase TatA/TatE family subunit [Chloroflexota bacterium]|jgi:sec-independent protein translocase protein TatA
MPDIGLPEILIILFVVLLLFGPGRLANVGRDLGRGIREFRDALQGKDSGPTKTDEASAAEGSRHE